MRQPMSALVPYDERTYEQLFKKKGFMKLSKSCNKEIDKQEIVGGDSITNINESISCSFFSREEYNLENMEIFIPAVHALNIYRKKGDVITSNEHLELMIYYLYNSEKPRFKVKTVENPVWKLCGLDDEEQRCPEWVCHGCIGMLNSGMIPIRDFEKFLYSKNNFRKIQETRRDAVSILKGMAKIDVGDTITLSTNFDVEMAKKFIPNFNSFIKGISGLEELVSTH
jgi:hypothetical protein